MGKWPGDLNLAARDARPVGSVDSSDSSSGAGDGSTTAGAQLVAMTGSSTGDTQEESRAVADRVGRHGARLSCRR